MSDSVREAISETFNSVIETMAFMMAEEFEGVVDADVEYLEGRMTYEGDEKSGVLHILAPREFCPPLAANMLGVEPGDEEIYNKGLDAFKELLNIICGQLLTQVYTDLPVFDLSVPQLESSAGKGGAWERFMQHSDAVGFRVEDEFNVAMRLERAEA